MTSSPKTNNFVDRAFTASMIAKGLNGLLEVVGGLFFLFTSSQTIQLFVARLTGDEISEDPNDFIAHLILSLGKQIGEAHLFGAAYLLVHGIVKLILVWYLINKKTSVYPLALAVLSLFALYQGYLLERHWSAPLLVLTSADVVIVWLVWLEYKRLKNEPIAE